MSRVTGFAPEEGRDAAPMRVAGGDGGQDGVVEARIPQIGFVGEQIAGLPEKRAGRGQHGPDHPGVEVVRTGRGVVTGELAAVRRGAAHDGVGHQRGGVVLDAPNSAAN